MGREKLPAWLLCPFNTKPGAACLRWLNLCVQGESVSDIQAQRECARSELEEALETDWKWLGAVNSRG